MSNKIKVFVRIRPLVSSEIECGAERVVHTDQEGRRIRVSIPAKNNTFEFDGAYGQNITQLMLYQTSCQPLIDSFFSGYNATVFAYGQTGSGKTYTMGNDGKESNEGIIPYAVEDIFQRCHDLNQNGYQTKLTLSYLEIYKEECYDLLSLNRNKCDIREGIKGETYVEGLTQQEIFTSNDVYQLLLNISKLRATAKTAMNSQSSRSHAICTFTLKTIKTQIDDSTGISTTITTNSSLNLVDLAGSERVKKTHASGDVFTEGVNINKGLLALGNVIVALSGGNNGNTASTHIPYRDSKITRILKDSLGGNSMTVMIACISPADSNFEETLNTLRFASRVSCIVNNITINKEYHGNMDNNNDSSNINQQLLQEICHLREQLQLLQHQSSSSSSSTSSLIMYGSSSSSSSSSPLSLPMDHMIPLISFIKNILIKCLEDDVLIDNDILENASQTLQKMKESLPNYPTTDSTTSTLEEDPFDFLPPIMKLIESFEGLEKWSNEQQQQLQQLQYNQSEELNSNSLLETNTKEISQNMGAMRALESYHEDDLDNNPNTSTIELMSYREKEVENMMKLATQYKENISKLRQEVQALEQEKQKVELKTNHVTGKNTGGGGPDAEILKEKLKLLEMKQKELRKKEVEYAKLLVQKEKACQEVTKLRNELDRNKQLRVEAQKKARQEAERYAEERKKLLHADSQLRRREQLAQEKVMKISQEFTNKDRVMRTQLEEKDREIKRLKQLGNDKIERVKSHKESLITTSNRRNNFQDHHNTPPATPAGSSAMGNGNATPATTTTTSIPISSKRGLQSQHKLDQSSLSNEQIIQLQGWLTREIDDQAWRILLNEEIKSQNEQRTSCNKRLAYLKQLREKESNSSCTIASRTDEEIQRENEIKHLEEEMRTFAIEIAKLNGQLADLGVVVEKRRFCNITNMKEAKFLMQTMFHKLSTEYPLERRQLETKILEQEKEIKMLLSQLNQHDSLTTTIPHTSANNEIKKRGKVPPSDGPEIKKSTGKELNSTSIHSTSTPNLTTLMRPTTSSAMHAKPKIPMNKQVPKQPLQSQSATIQPQPSSSSSSSIPTPSGTKTLLSRKESNSDHRQENEEGDEVNSYDDGDDREDEDDQYQSSSDDDEEEEEEEDELFDESFYPEDEILSDVSDEEEVEECHRRRYLKEHSSSTLSSSSSSSINSKKRSSKELDHEDEGSCETSSSAASTKNKKMKVLKGKSSMEEEEEELEMPSFPLSKYKVPELKKFLSDRALPVSGRKDDLIQRLTEYLTPGAVEVQPIINDENRNPLVNKSIASSAKKKRIGLIVNNLPLVSGEDLS